MGVTTLRSSLDMGLDGAGYLVARPLDAGGIDSHLADRLGER